MGKSTNKHETQESQESVNSIFDEVNPLLILQQEMDVDIYVVSGQMNRSLADAVVDKLQLSSSKRPNCIVYLCTFGGNPDAAYIIARAFKNHYDHLSVYISGYCKSAGTLIVLGADEIVMSEKGELGPLDVQLPRDDALADLLSGLDIATSINKLGDEAIDIFENIFLRIIGRSSGRITTKTAADIAVQLATGLVAPLAAQLDVFKFVESARSMDIAIHYGVRLGAHPELVIHLATDYPSHSFVIDYQEAFNLFPYVRKYNEVEILAEIQVQTILENSQGVECIREPHESGLIVQLDVDIETEDSIESDEEINQKTQGENVHVKHAEPQNNKDGK